MLIGAVRGGHVEIVRALLHKYADIDIRGQVSVGGVATNERPGDCVPKLNPTYKINKYVYEFV